LIEKFCISQFIIDSFAQILYASTMSFDFKDFATASMVLFAVIDVIGSIPIIISLREKMGHIHSEKASLVAIIVMILFLFVGESILGLIGINTNEFAVAGSFVLLFIALEMVLNITIFKDSAEGVSSATVFPLAFPLLAGPGTLTTLLSLRAEYDIQVIIAAIVANMILVYVVLKTSSKIQRMIGRNGIEIIRKIFGVILLAIAVKLFTSNIQELFNQ